MVWGTRMTLESINHRQNCFATLTYRDDTMPTTPAGLPTLTPNDLRLWLYKFRKAIKPTLIRFYAAGEYSPKERPHYHIVIFGFPGCAYGKSRYADGRTINCCYSCDLIRDTWQKGIIECEPFAPGHAKYVSGYVMKKMTAKTDKRLNGRHPEFSRQSNRPGIGANAVSGLAPTARARIESGAANDVPTAVRINGKISALGRYLRQQLRKELGGDGKAPQHVIDQMEAEMLPLLAASRIDPDNITLKQQIVARARGEIASLKARADIHNNRKRNRTL